MKRIDKNNYYLDIAEATLERATCLRKKWGAVIVKNDEIISTGYNGAPRGRKNCDDLGYCVREKLNIPRGERYELCRSVHAEQNAIISAPRKDMIGATMYLTGEENGYLEDGLLYFEEVTDASPCPICERMIRNSGIERVINRKGIIYEKEVK